MNQSNILPLKLEPFNYGQIKPLGWIKKQLEIQLNGLSGHLDEFWPDIKDSAWFGGKGEGWERVPYWLDGVIPLAKMLDNQELQQRIDKYMNHIMEHQTEDGWLGSKQSNVQNQKDRYDLWAQFLILKVLVFYSQIQPSLIKRIADVVEKGLRSIELTINFQPLFDWGQARWFEAFISIFWLYELKLSQANENKESLEWLLQLIVKLEAQGFGWKTFYKNWPMKQELRQWNFMSHIVNNAMAIKAYGLYYRLSGDASDRGTCDNIIEQLFKYHGTAVGTFTGDECLAGKDPIRGTELCAVVEQMFSLENLIQIFGDAKYCDQLEKIAYNALPGYFKEDMWAHQYDSQANQIECSITEERPWNTNGTDANIYGLEPHYGCCLANFHQGWPKFVNSLWMFDKLNNTLVSICYSPCQLNCRLQNVDIQIIEETDYPFDQQVQFTVQVQNPIEFSLKLRIPQWCDSSKVEIKGQQFVIENQYIIIKKLWNSNDKVQLTFPVKITLSHRFNNSISIERGPLVYSLKIEEVWKQINGDMPLRELPHGDFEVHAGSKWNYSIAIDEQQIENCFKVNVNKNKSISFNNSNPPVSLSCIGRELVNWKAKDGSHCEMPVSPIIFDKEQKEKTQDVQIQLIPYGCTHLRLTEIPYFNINQDQIKSKL